jgi:hypothetical protein
MLIAVARFCLGLPTDYKQWDCFLLSDYLNRQALIETFRKRNLPLSNGNDEENFEGQYIFNWEDHACGPSPVRVKTEPVSSRASASAVTTPAASAKTPPMVFDVEKGCLVPFE